MSCLGCPGSIMCVSLHLCIWNPCYSSSGECMLKHVPISRVHSVDRKKKMYEVTSKVQSFDVEVLVYRRNSVVKLGQSRKLNPVFSGPYLVTEVLSPYLYRVQGHKKRLVLHHDRLKLCEDRAVPFLVNRRRRSLLQQQSATDVVEGQLAVPSATEETD